MGSFNWCCLAYIRLRPDLVSLINFIIRFSDRYITGFECNTGSGAGIDVKVEVGLPVMTRVGAVAETSKISGVVAYCRLAICLVSRFDVFISTGAEEGRTASRSF